MLKSAKFAAIKVNGDGLITYDELKVVLAAFGMDANDTLVDTMNSEAETNCDDKVDLE